LADSVSIGLWLISLSIPINPKFLLILGYSLVHLAYYIDIVNTIASFAVFWEQFQGREVVEKVLKSKFGTDSFGVPDITR
jgi:hypothetical protein